MYLLNKSANYKNLVYEVANWVKQKYGPFWTNLNNIEPLVEILLSEIDKFNKTIQK